MNIKQISYLELEGAIYVSFHGDMQIKEMYDPNINISSISDIVVDIIKKIKEYGEVTMYAIYEENKVIGYFVNQKDRLISFGISTNYRIEKYLKYLLKSIKKKAGKYFYVLLWQKNIRAIKWLIKNGLTITFFDNNIIKFQCQ